MKLSAILAPLVAAGVDAETILKTVVAYEQQQEDALEKRREADRDRQRKKRENDKVSRDVTLRHSDSQRSRSHVRVEDNNKPTTKEDISSLRSENISIKPDFEREFETEIWPAYPRKVGKGQALKAYRAARKQTDCRTIADGVRRYAVERAGQDATYTKHAATWLNGRCWLDEPAPPPRPHANGPPFRERTIVDVINERIQNSEPPDDQFTIDAEYEAGPGNQANLHFLADATRRRS